MNKQLSGLGDPYYGETVESYVSYVEKYLAREQFTWEVLTELCRQYGIGIEEVAFHIAAEKLGMSVERVEAIATSEEG